MEKGTATVVKHTGSHYLLSVLPEWAPFPAVIRGKLRLAENQPSIEQTTAEIRRVLEI